MSAEKAAKPATKKAATKKTPAKKDAPKSTAAAKKDTKSPAKKPAAAKSPAKKPAAAKSPAKKPAAEAKKPAPAKAAKPEAEEPEDDDLDVVEEGGYQAKAKPELDDERRAALRQRAAKQDANPTFRRHEWFRYKDLGGKDAPWRRPRGMHSKQRRHFKYRPPVVSIGYRTPAAARGLHPSGFEEVIVHRPADLEELDPKTQAARIGGTVGGRKAADIAAKADELGIRILNRRNA